MDSKLYEQLLKKENEIWSRTQTDEHRARISAEDQVAARTLRLNRDSISLANFAKKTEYAGKWDSPSAAEKVASSGNCLRPVSASN
jgi:hypothetical protein